MQTITSINYTLFDNTYKFLFKDITFPDHFQFKQLLNPLRNIHKPIDIVFENVNTYNVLDFSFAFQDLWCDIYGLDTSHAENMNGMFSNTNVCNHDLIDTSNVKTAKYMFKNACLARINFNKINLHNIRNVKHMFRHCEDSDLRHLIGIKTLWFNWPLLYNGIEMDSVSKQITSNLSLSKQIDFLSIYYSNGYKLTYHMKKKACEKFIKNIHDGSLKTIITSFSFNFIERIFSTSDVLQLESWLILYSQILIFMKKWNIEIAFLKKIYNSMFEN